MAVEEVEAVWGSITVVSEAMACGSVTYGP